jgi:hypothetical protein
LPYVDDLISIRQNIATMVKTETALWVTGGPKPDYSIDGQSVSWTAWLSAMTDKLAALDKQIAEQDVPFELSQHWYT